jgi:hypothetical protein
MEAECWRRKAGNGLGCWVAMTLSVVFAPYAATVGLELSLKSRLGGGSGCDRKLVGKWANRAGSSLISGFGFADDGFGGRTMMCALSSGRRS